MSNFSSLHSEPRQALKQSGDYSTEYGGGHHDDHDSGCDTVPSTDTSTDTTSHAPVVQNGTAGDDVLIGGPGWDLLFGQVLSWLARVV